MALSQGDTLPDATLVEMGAEGPAPVNLADKTKGRKVVIFAVPGAKPPPLKSTATPTRSPMPRPRALKPNTTPRGSRR